jgi:magnesium transporter
VDSFFPLLKEIEEHVMVTESVVYNEDNPASTTSPIPLANTQALRIVAAGEKAIPATSFIDEKHADAASVKTAMTQFSLPKLTCGLMLRRWGCAISGFFCFCRRSKPRMVMSRFAGASSDLYRMSRTRRLATSVARLLATKPDVIAGIRKRLLSSDGPDVNDDVEVAIYFGDVQGEVTKYRSVCVS